MRTCFPWDLHAQTRTTTGRHSVALATPTLRRLHREKKQRRSPHVTLRQRCARWTHHRRLQWRNTLTNKQTKRTRSTNRKYDIETWLLAKTFARTTSMQEPEYTNCFNSRPRRLLKTKIQTHTNASFAFYKFRMIRCHWKTTSSRSAETKRDKGQLAQHIAQTQSDELRCNHNTLMGLHWWTGRTANTPRKTPALKNLNLETLPEGWTRNDLATWLSEKRCWMNSSLTSELKQTNIKKTQSVRNMNNESIMIHLIEQERTTKSDGWTHHRRLHGLKNRAPSKRRNRQEYDPKGSLEQYLRMKNLVNNKLESDWLNPDPSGPTRKRHNVTTLQCNRPPQSRQNESNDPLVLTAKNMFSLRSPCSSTNNNWQTLCSTCHSHTEKTAQREEPKIISSRHSATKECEVNSSATSSDATHWPTNRPNEPETSTKHMTLTRSFW